MKISFATGNKNKVFEANQVGREKGVEFQRIRQPYPEVRSDDVAEVALKGVEYVHNKVGGPVIVEDSGFFVNALNGFPGAYSAMVYDKIGLAGVLRLMEGLQERSCLFKAAVAYMDGEEHKVFTGIIKGTMTKSIQGDGGFGYDPVFIPEGASETYATNPEQKRDSSHRKKALEKFLDWLSEKKLTIH